MWLDAIDPDDAVPPKAVVAAMKAADRIIYSVPAGAAGQRSVSVVSAYLDKDEGPFRVSNNFCTLELMSSEYARFSERTIRALHGYYEKMFRSAKTWRITTPSGTDISGQIGTVSSRQAMFEGMRSPYAAVFPSRIHAPIGSVNASGRIAIDHCAIPPMKIENPPIVEFVEDRVVGVEGGPEAEVYRKALEANAERWGDNANFLDSWHSGLNPYGPNITGFLGHGCSARMHLHIGRSDTYTSAGVVNHTIEIDGRKVLDNGKLVVLDDPKVREAVGLS